MLDFARTESQSMIADSLRRLLEQEGFEARRARLGQNRPDRMALWPTMVEQGLLGAFLPEDAGGFSGAGRDVAVIFHAVGRALAVEPLMGALQASRLLLASRADEAEAAIAALVSGEHVFVFAHAESLDPFSPPATTATADASGWMLTGHKPVVRHADVADRMLVTAMTGEGVGCFLVETDAVGCAIEPLRLIDGSGAANVTLNSARATAILTPGEAAAAVAQALDWGMAALSAETAGIVEALNEQTREYLRVRKQFGVPLASFQALQHRAADMFIAGEELAVALDALIDALDTGDHLSPRWSGVKLIADRAGRKIGHEAIQLHGGMGVSDELIVSHYARRLAAIRSELGGAAVHSARVKAASDPGLAVEEAPDVCAFREEVRRFVREACPPDLRRKAELGLLFEKEDYRRWERILRKQGWFAAAWPEEYGGCGWNLSQQLTFVQEAALNDAPPIIPYGVNMLGPVIYTFGTPEQRERFLPGILNSETWWCQGYSEPNAGSDLASLKTFAELDGDHYVVNGTKMWTTEAQWADMMHCLVRTRRDGRPQDGISFLLIDMTAPGVSIQPIITLDGQYHTNQTFLDNVRVPKENMVGGEGQGWKLAKFLLGNERIAIADTGAKLRLLQQVREDYNRQRAEGVASAVVLESFGERLSAIESDLAVLVLLERRYVEYWDAGGARNGPEASLLKIRGTEILQALTELAMEMGGAYAPTHDPADLHRIPGSHVGSAQKASVMANHYLYARCWSIFGGSNEIQRNIIAKCIGVG